MREPNVEKCNSGYMKELENSIEVLLRGALKGFGKPVTLVYIGGSITLQVYTRWAIGFMKTPRAFVSQIQRGVCFTSMCKLFKKKLAKKS